MDLEEFLPVHRKCCATLGMLVAQLTVRGPQDKKRGTKKGDRHSFLSKHLVTIKKCLSPFFPVSPFFPSLKLPGS